jgi:hypothetical protein
MKYDFLRRLDVRSASDDHLNFPGKRSLVSFLSWLDYCDQLIAVAHPQVAERMVTLIRQLLMEACLKPGILQAYDCTNYLIIRCNFMLYTGASRYQSQQQRTWVDV